MGVCDCCAGGGADGRTLETGGVSDILYLVQVVRLCSVCALQYDFIIKYGTTQFITYLVLILSSA